MSEYVIRSVEEIGEALAQIASSADTTHYQEFAVQLGMSPHVRNWQNHPLSKDFGHLDRQDYAASRPFRTAVVVQSGPEIPGEGFFETVTKLRHIELPKRLRKQWQFELSLVHEHYKRT